MSAGCNGATNATRFGLPCSLASARHTAVSNRPTRTSRRFIHRLVRLKDVQGPLVAPMLSPLVVGRTCETSQSKEAAPLSARKRRLLPLRPYEERQFETKS